MARLAFLGTPAVAASMLLALAGAGHDIAVAVTQPDKRRGRGGAATPTPVKTVAESLGVQVAHTAGDAAGLDVELGVVVAYGRIIRPEVLAEVPMVNVHFSLLPRWRGAAPVERAILAGDEETGVCLMEVVEELDAGGVYQSRRVVIGDEQTAPELTRHLGDVGTTLLLQALSDLPGSLGTPVPQVGEVVYADKIDSEELRLDWSEPAAYLSRVVRVGRAWTVFRGKRLVVWGARPVPECTELAPGSLDGCTAGTGHGALALEEVQPEGRRRMDASDWLRGIGVSTGERLGK